MNGTGRLRLLLARVAGLRVAVRSRDFHWTPEAERMRSALDMHDPGVQLYRQRMRPEHPDASSGIESEAVASATRREALPQLSAPVATAGHLIALKTLAGRNQDLTDLGSLIPAASAEDLQTARNAVRLIQAPASTGTKTS